MDIAARPGPDDWLILRAEQSLDDQNISYRALLERAQQWSAAYRRRGLGVGARVLISMPLGLDLVASHLGAMLIGAIPAMFTFPNFKHAFASYANSLSQVCAIGAYRTVVVDRSLAHQLKIGGIDLLGPDILGKAMDLADMEQRIDPNATAIFQYSSGTTGLKKGLPLTHAQILGFVDAYASTLRLNVAKDRIASWLPLFHDMGFIACWILPLLTGCPLYAMSAQDWVKAPRSLAEAIERHRCSLVWLPNFAFSLMKNTVRNGYDLSSVRSLVNSSEVIRAKTVEEFFDHFAESGLSAEGLGGCYGMAENTYAVTQSTLGGGLRQIHVDRAALDRGRIMRRFPDFPAAVSFVSSGRPVGGTSVLLESDGEVHQDQDRVGEILISGPFRFDGYDGRTPDQSGIDPTGRFRSGDFGFFHGGELFVIGRKDDVIIHAGKNIFPEDIEDAASKVEGVVPGRVVAFGRVSAVGGTQEIVVLAETKIDEPSHAARVKAAVLQHLGQSIDAPIAELHLMKHMTLLKSTSGKISRRQNRSAYAAGELQPLDTAVAAPESGIRGLVGRIGRGLAARREEMTERQMRIAKCIEAVLQTKSSSSRISIAKNTSVVKTGLIDSLSFAVLLVELERALSIPIPMEGAGDIEDFDTVASIEAWLDRQTAKRPVSAARKARKFDLNFLPSGVGQFGERPTPEQAIRQANQWITDLYALSALPKPPRDHINGMGDMNAPFFSSQSLSTDNHGFRSTLAGGQRITLEEFRNLPARELGFIVGASASFGTGASADAHCFPNVLNAMSGANGALWFNASLRSANLKGELSVLRHYGGFDGLRRLLLFSGTNDFQYFADALTAEERVSEVVLRQAEIDVRYEAFLAEFRSDLGNIRGWAKQRNLAMFFVLQPIIPFIEGVMTEADAFHFGNMRKLMGRRIFANNYSAGKYLWLLRCRFQEDVEALCEEIGIPYLNPARSAAFRGAAGIFVDYWHYNDQGHKILAEEIAVFLDRHA